MLTHWNIKHLQQLSPSLSTTTQEIILSTSESYKFHLIIMMWTTWNKKKKTGVYLLCDNLLIKLKQNKAKTIKLS